MQQQRTTINMARDIGRVILDGLSMLGSLVWGGVMALLGDVPPDPPPLPAANVQTYDDSAPANTYVYQSPGRSFDGWTWAWRSGYSATTGRVWQVSADPHHPQVRYIERLTRYTGGDASVVMIAPYFHASVRQMSRGPQVVAENGLYVLLSSIAHASGSMFPRSAPDFATVFYPDDADLAQMMTAFELMRCYPCSGDIVIWHHPRTGGRR